MQKIKAFSFVFVAFALISAVFCEPPSYSAQYAKIRYQPLLKSPDLTKSELNLDQIHKEEVTEKLIPSRNEISQNDSQILSAAELPEVTTESESEQINFARFRQSKVLKDKLREQNVNAQTTTDDQSAATFKDYAVEIDPMQINYTKEKNLASDYTESDKDDLVDEVETLNYSAESEISDLNEQGVYYIIHPNGLYQKVVYKTYDEPENMQVSTQVKYENIEPIVEPVYTYDPRTFLFQRLILGPQQK